jgi:hypothetical protein
MPAHLFDFLNGINRKVNQFTGWDEDAVDWIHSPRTPANWRANNFAYSVGTFDRWRKQAGLIEAAADKLWRWQTANPGTPTTVAAHSNGCAIACGMLRTNPGIVIDRLHLIAAAEWASFDANGLNAAVLGGRVNRVVLHCSTADEYLGLAEYGQWLHWVNARFGYGSLGKSGPKDVDPRVLPFVDVVWREGYRHSDYFAPDGRFEKTMRRIAFGADDATEPRDFIKLPTYDLPPIGTAQ